jgi:hypothetical protein
MIGEEPSRLPSVDLRTDGLPLLSWLDWQLLIVNEVLGCLRMGVAVVVNPGTRSLPGRNTWLQTIAARGI